MTPTSHQPADKKTSNEADSCSTPINPNAPAGSPGSLGSKSDCNGRPSSDDSVVEAKDEMGPELTPPVPDREARR